MLGVLLAALGYGAFFIAVELLGRKLAIKKETSRKIVHIIAGVAAAALPLALSFRQIAVLSALFIPFMLVSKGLNIFSSIHQVARTTYGEIFFPASILLVAVLFPHRIGYCFALLVMALSDGFASIFGERYGKSQYRIGAAKKSYLGSAVFLACTLALSLAALLTTNMQLPQVLLLSAIMAIFLTFVEALLAYGLDNLIIPPVAGLLVWAALQLAG